MNKAPTTANALVLRIRIKTMGNSIKNAKGLIAQETPIHFAKPVPPWNLK